MQKSLILFILLSFMAISNPIFGQTRTKTTKTTTSKKKQKEEYKLLDHVTGDLLVGNIGFQGGLFISSKLTAGYKLNDRFSAGLGGKLFYNRFNLVGQDDITLSDKGGMIYARGKVTENLFLQAEYNVTNFGNRTINFNSPLIGGTKYYPTFGGGYYSGYSDWRYGIQLLFVPNREIQDYISIVEYWVGLTYKF